MDSLISINNIPELNEIFKKENFIKKRRIKNDKFYYASAKIDDITYYFKVKIIQMVDKEIMSMGCYRFNFLSNKWEVDPNYTKKSHKLIRDRCDYVKFYSI